MSNNHPKTGLTLRYAKEFECTGSACPDNCCHHWRVYVGREIYEKLQQVLPRDQLKTALKKSEKGNSGAYAEIVLQEDGTCPFLDASDALCAIHKKYGPNYLGVTCRQYPRQVSLVGERIELGLSLSCPEAARRCLLNDSAIDLVEFDPEMMLKNGIEFFHVQADRVANRYQSYLNDFREIMLQLLANRNLPFDSRVFVALYFAKQVSAYVHEGMLAVDDSRIAQELDLLLAPGCMDGLHAEFSALSVPAEFSMSLLQTIIWARISRSGGMSRLILSILSENGIKVEFTATSTELVSDIGVSQAVENMSLRYQERSDLLRKRYGVTIDQYFENYSRNFWFKDLFVKSPSLFDHMRELIVRLTVVKFLFFSNPGLNCLFDSTNMLSPDEIRRVLDETAVSTFYQFSRGIEHSRAVMDVVYAELAKQKMDSFAHLVLLLKF